MTSIRIPFESYAAQVAQNYNSTSDFSQNGPSIAIDSTYDDNKSQFQFQPQITTFAINSVDEDEDPEEKMHSPRTPYGSVPDSIANNHKKFKFNNTNTTNHTLYPPKLETMQRTISASSFESIRSSSFDSSLGSLGYAPTLSATSSITRCDLKPFDSSSSPDTSPCHTPKPYKLSLNKMHMALDDNDAVEELHEEPKRNGNAFSFGEEKNARNENIEAIHKALMEVKTKKQNGFVLYKHGLATYSACNSGSNTAGTATPNSIGALSRSSSCGSVGSAETHSVCSFDDHAIDDHDLSLSLDEFVDVRSGTATPVVLDMFNVVHVAGNGNGNGVASEDEMETPVPASRDQLLSPEGEGAEDGKSPFDFDIGRNGFGLAQISEDVEHGTLVTPNTDLTDCKTDIHSYDMLEEDESDDEDEPLPSSQRDGADKCMEFEDEIIVKGSRFQSSRILFLDVDGVLLSTKEQGSLGKGENIKFNDDVTSLMIKLRRETDCDVVISSTWQFHTESHLPYLIAYLVACGWRRNKIHTLLDLLPSHANDGIDYGREWYEQSPYCRCRARGIQKIVQLYGNYITRWCCLDDLPLHSAKLVCIPKKEDITYMVERVSCAYFKPFTWRQNESVALMPDIKYCVRYALTSLPNCIFSTQSYRFGYEYNQTMIYYQADAIAKLCKLTYEVKDNGTYQLILQNMMAVMQQYVSGNLSYQGDPFIAPYLVQTDQNTGITVENIENTITLLTYQTPLVLYPGNDMDGSFNSV